ncbi:hypothetical protein ACUN0C_18695 [Faunimonas sp. B44]|uniref:hypothetical protein n=1 Tax=Faunimonas sp. B44 TaxID=3461493 RepID=UPI0040443322
MRYQKVGKVIVDGMGDRVEAKTILAALNAIDVFEELLDDLYDRECAVEIDHAAQALIEAGGQLTWWPPKPKDIRTILKDVVDKQYVDTEDLEVIEEWLNSPE